MVVSHEHRELYFKSPNDPGMDIEYIYTLHATPLVAIMNSAGVPCFKGTLPE